MVQRIRNFAEALRRRLGIIVKCAPCGRQVTYLCRDFEGVLKPNDDIEMRLWQCRACGSYSTWIRYTTLDGIKREDIASWTPLRGDGECKIALTGTRRTFSGFVA